MIKNPGGAVLGGAATFSTVIASNLPNVIARSGIPFIIAPTGTMANNGAVTLGTALPLIYANAFIFLPASAISAGSGAGWYFCQMTSATVGTVFNNTYVSGTPTIPTGTPFATTGPGAFTGVTAFTAGAVITLPANTMGPNSVLRETSLWSTTNNANAKTLAFAIGATTIVAGSAASAGVVQQLTFVTNRGAQNVNVSFAQNNSTGVGLANPAPLLSTINFGVSQTLAWGATPTVATDGMVMESYLVEVIPG